ncbi:MAG: ChaN family lipoprotein [Desulfomonilaceae bacterium]
MARLVWFPLLAAMVSVFLAYSTLLGYCDIMEESSCPSIIVDVYAGEPISFDAMLDDLETVSIVYLGELHTIQRHHNFQLAVIRGLFQRRPSLYLGMEMFNAGQQEVLDRWLAGHDSLARLGEQLGSEKWTNLSDYESLLLFARRNGIQVVGLNVSNDLVRKVVRGQQGDLSKKELKDLPEEALLTPNPLYDKLLRLKLRVHKAFQGKSLDGVIRGQLLRDSVMAQTIVRTLESLKGKNPVFAVVAGSGHLGYGFGIPERVRAKMQVSDRIILPTESGHLILSDEERRQAVPVEITHEDLRFIREPIADYLYVLPMAASHPESKELADALPLK